MFAGLRDKGKKHNRRQKIGIKNVGKRKKMKTNWEISRQKIRKHPRKKKREKSTKQEENAVFIKWEQKRTYKRRQKEEKKTKTKIRLHGEKKMIEKVLREKGKYTIEDKSRKK